MSSNATALAIFGARGFIGGHVARALDADGEFTVRGFSSADVDLTNVDQMAAIAASVDAGSILLFAAAAQPDSGMPPTDLMMANMDMAGNMADLVRAVRPAQAIYLSSVDVYGRYGLELPLSESSTIRPDSPYAISKFATERLLALACHEVGAAVTILRLPGVYGPGDTHHGPVRSFLDAARAGEPIRIHGDGHQRRDLLYVGDVPSIIAAVCRQRVEGVFNAMTGQTHSLNEIADTICRVLGRPIEILHEDTDMPQADLAFAQSALLRVIPELSFTPLEEGLRRTREAADTA